MKRGVLLQSFQESSGLVKRYKLAVRTWSWNWFVDIVGKLGLYRYQRNEVHMV